MNLPQAIEIAKGIASLVAIVGLPITYLTYRRGERTRRADLLISLHVRFFETELFSRVRRVLDYRQEPDYTRLVDAVASEAYHPLADELFRYLNFFELLASLQSLKQLRRAEILKLFEYDLSLIKERPFVMAALPTQGFEQLLNLLKSNEFK